jgi:hypothetical protein
MKVSDHQHVNKPSHKLPQALLTPMLMFFLSYVLGNSQEEVKNYGRNHICYRASDSRGKHSLLKKSMNTTQNEII